MSIEPMSTVKLARSLNRARSSLIPNDERNKPLP